MKSHNGIHNAVFCASLEPYLSPRIDDSINRLDETIQTLVHSMADLDERIRELEDKVDQIDYQKGLEDVI